MPFYDILTGILCFGFRCFVNPIFDAESNFSYFKKFLTPMVQLWYILKLSIAK